MLQALERHFLDAYEAHADAIFRFCFFRVGNKAVVEDFVQETFTRTWKYLHDGNQIESIKAFLYRTARNIIIDGVRQKKPQASVEERIELGLEPKGDDAETILLKIEIHEILENSTFSLNKNAISCSCDSSKATDLKRSLKCFTNLPTPYPSAFIVPKNLFSPYAQALDSPT